MKILAKEDSAKEETTRGYKAFRGFITRTNIPALQRPATEEVARIDQPVPPNSTQSDQNQR